MTHIKFFYHNTKISLSLFIFFFNLNLSLLKMLPCPEEVEKAR